MAEKKAVTEKLTIFCEQSNKVTPRASDFERWEDFIIAAYDHGSEVSIWVFDHLIANGFDEDIAFDFYHQYRTAINVLKRKGA